MTKIFPPWNPQEMTIRKFGLLDRKMAFKAFRNSCSGFISRKDVRDIVLKTNNHKCCKCGNLENLQLDHVKSVWFCFKNSLMDYCNLQENLQILCHKCNAGKKP